MYVSDQLLIQMRSGKTNSHRIFASLRSGDVVTVIDEDKASGYSLVRSKKGKEGWVVTRFLMGQPSARSQLKTKQSRIDSLSGGYAKAVEENKSLKIEIKELKNIKSTLARKNLTLKSEVDELNKNFGGEISFQDRFINSQKKIDELNNEIILLNEDNLKLNSKSDQLWVMAGGGILFLGIIFGLLIPKIRWQKRSTWSSL